MMLKRPVRLENSTKVIITLNNPIQQDIFNRLQIEFHTFLRRELDNGEIKIFTEIQELAKEEMLYTNREKFEYMTSVNPVLKEMQERLGLDPDL